MFVAGIAFGEGNAPINYGTYTHAVKKPPATTFTPCDFDFTGLNVCGLSSGGGDGTVTSFSAGNLSPLFSTTVTDPTANPTLLFNQSSSAAHTYYGNNTAGTAAPGFHVIDFSELSGVPPSTHSVTMVVDGSGVLTSGTKNPVKIPYGGTLQGWVLIGKPSGSITIDVLRAADGAGLPVTSIIGGGTKPALSSAVENSSTSFSGWTSTTLTAKDNLAISLSGITSSTYCQLTLYYQ